MPTFEKLRLLALACLASVSLSPTAAVMANAKCLLVWRQFGGEVGARQVCDHVAHVEHAVHDSYLEGVPVYARQLQEMSAMNTQL